MQSVTAIHQVCRMAKERLHKIISRSGLMSRRHAEQAILDGRVKLNGNIVREMGVQANVQSDQISVDDQPLPQSKTVLTIALYKPRRMITSRSDPQGRRTVMELVQEHPTLYPVGRLDYDSEGLLLLTNDGDLANLVMHPRSEIPKIYEVQVNRSIKPEELTSLENGLHLEDGLGRFQQVKMVKFGSKPTLEVTVSEGRNRFIRRMFESLEFRVEKLKRIQVGHLKIGALNPGQYRELTDHEVAEFRSLPSHPLSKSLSEASDDEQ